MKRSAFDIALEHGQQREGSFARMLSHGTLFECKADLKFRTTGNLFIEFRQGKNAVPSGIHPKSTKADWWVTEFIPNHWLVIPTSEMRTLARSIYRERESMGWSPFIVGGDNLNRGVLVPFLRVFPFLRREWLTRHLNWMQTAGEPVRVASAEEIAFFGKPLPEAQSWEQMCLL